MVLKDIHKKIEHTCIYLQLSIFDKLQEYTRQSFHKWKYMYIILIFFVNKHLFSTEFHDN